MANYGGQGQQRWGDNTANTNAYITDMQLTDQAGRTCHTGQARARGVLILSFVDATQAATVPFLRYLEQLNVGYTATGKVTVWPIFLYGTTEQVDTLVLTSGFSGSRLRDHDGYYAQIFGISDYPTTLVVNSTGIVIAKSKRPTQSSIQSISVTIAALLECEDVISIG